ncbi:hypothetical protein BU24DRAFT_442210 [Aaosphaeria arxii CBS 175.79]|uniref:Integral membrane protein n=1 Tax=Aaosphaeria arxii CBS 175.79 TaxID=1450172 RepID=A0A6A5XQS9_9PLEO|nr:uncharacterized protein BU24DRAFT_442210 [Aaosphaeria arxii CBS 175.79]KAF2015090.1 hypothetical protein BU24DRAFT_442210 [Aaosphaeria arxii CBS 175.79]
MDVPSIAFGFTLGFVILTGMKIGRQSMAMYKRTKKIWNPYPWMCWSELIVNLVMAVLTWLFLHEDIKGSFAFFFILVTTWVLQTQLLIQIIANRVALVMTDKRKATKLKWALFVAVGLINISVYCIWIPARMQISPMWIHLNEIWDRIEKVIYLLIDFALNAYFLYLVRARLISKGLTKYTPLFNFNAIIIVVSLSMDVLLIGMMSLRNTFIYVQFHPVSYIVKLNIECSMADLISKIVRGNERTDAFHSGSNSYPTELASRSAHGTKMGNTTHTTTIRGNHTARGGEEESDSSLDEERGAAGIMKTVATTVVHDAAEKEDSRSVSSSTVQLNDDYQVGAKSSF